MMKKTIFLFAAGFLILATLPLPAQIIWSEDFNYLDGTTVGANNNTANPAPDWTSFCVSCGVGDHYEVQNGLMEGNDTNGPASMETESIDISAYPAGVEVTAYLEEDGDMEGCPGGVSSGCNSVDWIRIEYKLDNGAYQDASSPLGGPCSGACAGATYVTLDDFGNTTFSLCPLVGDSLRLRISVQCWASGEFLRIDDVVVQAQSCDPFVASDSIIHVICNSELTGEIWINATGPAQPFEYRLGNGAWQSQNFFTNLAAGTYDVYVRNQAGDIIAFNNLVVLEPDPIVYSDSLVHLSCQAGDTGEIHIFNLMNGTRPFSFSVDASPFQSDSSFTGLAAGGHLVEIRDNLGCIVSDSLFLIELSGFTVITSPDLVICSGLETAQLEVTVNGGVFAFFYDWTCDAANCVLDSLGDDDPIVSPSSTTTYYITVTDSIGCSSQPDTIVVKVEEIVQHPAPEDLEFCPGEPIEFGVEAVAGFSYEWTPGTGINDPFASQVMAAFLETTTCTLTVTNDTMQSPGCRTQEFEVLLNADNCLLPNVFTPNGDGFNDVLYVGEFFNQVELYVFDRWGVRVFTDMDYDNDWGGWNENGGQLKPGVYFYFLKAQWFDPDNDVEEVKSYQKGQNVTLLR